MDLSTTVHWTQVLDAEQRNRLLDLSALYEDLAAIEQVMERRITEAGEEGDVSAEQVHLKKRATTTQTLIDEVKEKIVAGGYNLGKQFRIELRPATGRTEAAFRLLLDEAGEVFQAETRLDLFTPAEWPEEARAADAPEQVLATTLRYWATAMSQIKALYTRTVDLLETDPHDYIDRVGNWSEEDIPSAWRDPALAPDEIPDDLLTAIAVQAINSRQNGTDARFLPPAVQRRLKRGESATA